jgi:hypothetical protein
VFLIVEENHVEAKVKTFQSGECAGLDEIGSGEREHGEFIALGVVVDDPEATENGLGCALAVGRDGGQRVLGWSPGPDIALLNAVGRGRAPLAMGETGQGREALVALFGMDVVDGDLEVGPDTVGVGLGARAELDRRSGIGVGADVGLEIDDNGLEGGEAVDEPHGAPNPAVGGLFEVDFDIVGRRFGVLADAEGAHEPGVVDVGQFFETLRGGRGFVEAQDDGVGPEVGGDGISPAGGKAEVFNAGGHVGGEVRGELDGFARPVADGDRRGLGEGGECVREEECAEEVGAREERGSVHCGLSGSGRGPKDERHGAGRPDPIATIRRQDWFPVRCLSHAGRHAYRNSALTSPNEAVSVATAQSEMNSS